MAKWHALYLDDLPYSLHLIKDFLMTKCQVVFYDLLSLEWGNKSCFLLVGGGKCTYTLRVYFWHCFLLGVTAEKFISLFFGKSQLIIFFQTFFRII